MRQDGCLPELQCNDCMVYRQDVQMLFQIMFRYLGPNVIIGYIYIYVYIYIYIGYIYNSLYYIYILYRI